MKIHISDMFNKTSDFAPDLSEEKIRKDAVRNKVLKKLGQDTAETKKIHRLKKPVFIAAVLAAAIGVCGFAYAYVRWAGFSYTEGLTEADKEAIEEQASRTSSEEVDAEGNITYFDEEGNETMTMTEEEAEKYWEQMEAERNAAVQESTDKVDVYTFDTVPQGITEVFTDETGVFEDFMLGYQYAALFFPENSEGYALTAGDTVTVSLTAKERVGIEFGYILKGVASESELVWNTDFSYDMKIPEDGVYCFYIRLFSDPVVELSNGKLEIS